MSETAVLTPPKGPEVTKIEAVRQAMAKLGKNATRGELQNYVKQQFGFEMTLDHISNTKNKVQSKKPKGKAKKSAAMPTALAAPATPMMAKAPPTLPAPKAADNGKSGVTLQDIESVKGLVGRVGPDQLRFLVNLLAK